MAWGLDTLVTSTGEMENALPGAEFHWEWQHFPPNKHNWVPSSPGRLWKPPAFSSPGMSSWWEDVESWRLNDLLKVTVLGAEQRWKLQPTFWVLSSCWAIPQLLFISGTVTPPEGAGQGCQVLLWLLFRSPVTFFIPQPARTEEEAALGTRGLPKAELPWRR